MKSNIKSYKLFKRRRTGFVVGQNRTFTHETAVPVLCESKSQWRVILLPNFVKLFNVCTHVT